MANYIPISTVTVGSGGAASISFTGIPQTYTDLIAVFSIRTNNNASYDNLQVTFNNDTGANYSRRWLRGDGTTADSYSGTANNYSYASNSLTGSTATANTFGNSSLYIPNYTGSTQKSHSFDVVAENNATTGYNALGANLWTGTTPITSITFTPNSGTLFSQYSTATLYGIRKY